MSCSIGLAAEREQYVMKLHASLREMPRGSKAWWTKSRELLRKKGKCDGIPALKTDAGEWAMAPGDKAKLFAESFVGQITLPDIRHNEYSTPRVDVHTVQERVPLPNIESA